VRHENEGRGKKEGKEREALAVAPRRRRPAAAADLSVSRTRFSPVRASTSPCDQEGKKKIISKRVRRIALSEF